MWRKDRGTTRPLILILTAGALIPLSSPAATGSDARTKRLPIVDRAIEHHGGDAYRKTRVQLDVCSRSGCYHVVAVQADDFLYEVEGPARGGVRRVRWTPRELELHVDGRPVGVEPGQAQPLRDWVMARVYFPFLPYRLNDPSAFKEDFGLVDWNGRRLHKVKVTFEPGSSTDASDEYVYFFDPSTGRVEFFAYSFEGSPGGLRFREAFNFRRVGGILFFDQRNLGVAGDEWSVDDITPEFVRDRMKMVSTVEIRDLQVVPMQATVFAEETPTRHTRTLEGTSSPPATIADVAWIAGHWRGAALGGQVEEVWSPPLGNAMMGMFRLVKDDQASFYELLTLVEEEGSVVLRLKHFNLGLQGWEEKDESVTFKLVEARPGRADFDGLTFLKDGDNLRVYVASRDAEGSVTELEFLFRAVAPKPTSD